MGVDIDWGLLQQPNFGNALLQGYEAGRQLNLQHQSDQALAAARANPTDMGALANLATFNAPAANALLAVDQNNRLAEARHAAGAVYQAYANGLPGGATGQQGAQGGPQPSQAGTSQTQPVGALLSPSNPVAQQVGQAVTSGGVSMPQALAFYASKADPAEVQQLIGNLKSMDDLRISRLNDAQGALATAAQSLLAVPQEQRQAAAMQMLPQLTQHGITPQMIQQADLSDAGLHGIIGQAIGVKGLIEQANTDRTAAETHRHNVAEENKPVSVAFGNTMINPATGKVVYDGMGGQSNSGDFSNVPFGQVKQQIINNEAPASVGGYNAVAYNTGNGGNSAGLKPVNLTGMTIGQVLDYQKNVVRPATKGQRGAGDPGSTGVGAYQFESGTLAQQAQAAFGDNWRNVKFTPDNQDKIAETLYNSIRGDRDQLHNTWAVFRGAGTTGGMGGAIETQAQQIAAYNMPPPTGRAATSAQGMAIMQRVGQLNPDYDATKYHEKNTGATAFGSGKLGNQVRSLNVAVDHLDQLGQVADALNNDDNRTVNAVGNAIAAWSGKPAPTNFAAVRDFVMDEVGKSIIGSPGTGGDRDKAQQIIGAANSPAQLSGAIKQVQGLMGGQLNGLRRQYEDVTGNGDFEAKISPRARQVLESHGGNAPVKVASDADYANLASGTVFIGPDGKTRRKP